MSRAPVRGQYNMGAEIGATTSIFGYDKHMGEYLRVTGRGSVADLADANSELLCSDQDVIDNPRQVL